jgi:hypothetical protein
MMAAVTASELLGLTTRSFMALLLSTPSGDEHRAVECPCGDGSPHPSLVAEPRAGTPAVPMIAERLRRRVPLRAPRLTRVSVGDARPPRGERNAGAGGAAGVVTPLRCGIISCALVDRGDDTPERGFRVEDASMRSGPGVGRLGKRP